jgi:hypothetical protein
MRRSRPLPFAIIALGIAAILLVAGFASIATAGAGAAPVTSEGVKRAQAAPVFTPIATPVPVSDPSGGKAIDRRVWLEHALPAAIFTILIWGVVAAVIIGIVTTGRLKGPQVPGQPDLEAMGQR